MINVELYKYIEGGANRVMKSTDIDWSDSISERRQEVLIKLINWLDKKKTPLEFNMRVYAKNDDVGCLEDTDLYIKENLCGTSCCVIGLIPHISKSFAKRHTNNKNIDFERMAYDLANDNKEVFDWLFSIKWDNDKQHARQRLIYYCFYGKVPDNFSYVFDDDSIRDFRIKVDWFVYNKLEKEWDYV